MHPVQEWMEGGAKVQLGPIKARSCDISSCSSVRIPRTKSDDGCSDLCRLGGLLRSQLWAPMPASYRASATVLGQHPASPTSVTNIFGRFKPPWSLLGDTPVDTSRPMFFESVYL
ncbi:hypothetical protein S40285_09881 [Stachybotrys chlorohalonatus IBT 40285]|uniref:Uncharacterized protein n=1 Tax=Stachybotrys chlorohalonatus (strain IBT 40285) TaxID=1283841 RepID=A0A084QUY0_STAC4|nr:hypothetical protein S40285_09881 [Stachybotrys chlorohalonata IBT 40285]